MARLIHNLVTHLLIAAVMSGSLVSPAVWHAHVDGNLPHSHEADVASHDARHEHHRHGHGTPHDHESSDRVERKLSDCAAHCHVALLWFDFTLPHEGEPSEPQNPFGERPVIVKPIIPDAVTNSIGTLTTWKYLTGAPAVFAELSDAANSPVQQALYRPVDRILLCDSARCERSGVLLI
jgi:hypothetical protein